MPPIVRRISKRNAAFQYAETLKRNRHKRTKAGEIFVEGVSPIDLCVAKGHRISQVLCSESRKLSGWADDVIASQSEVVLYLVADTLFESLSDRDESSEIVVIANRPEYELGTFPDRLDRIVILDRPASPGNLGSIIRSCDSFGIDLILISGHGADPYDPKSIAASRGTVFAIPIVAIESNGKLEEFIANLRGAGEFVVYGSSAHPGSEIGSVTFSPRFALIVGNESTGMSPFLKALSEIVLSIPMRGSASSLNVATAASILIYELTRSPTHER